MKRKRKRKGKARKEKRILNTIPSYKIELPKSYYLNDEVGYQKVSH